MQAQKARFAGARDREPLFWVKHDPVRMLDGDTILGDAKLPAEARIELAVTFPGIEVLPDNIANKVPDPSKGTPLQPPGAFTVSTAFHASSGLTTRHDAKDAHTCQGSKGCHNPQLSCSDFPRKTSLLSLICATAWVDRKQQA